MPEVKYTITFEVDDQVIKSIEALHELLCLCIYEDNKEAGQTLNNGIEDIGLPGDEA